MNSLFEHDEILFHVLLNVDYFDLLELCSISKRFNDMCHNKLLWIEKAKQDFNIDIRGTNVTNLKTQYFKLYDQFHWWKPEYDELEREEIDDLASKISTSFDLLVGPMLKRIRIIEQHSNQKPRIYFQANTSDYSIKTRFDELSNELKVGVIAKSKLAAGAILGLVKIFFDRSFDILGETFNNTLDNGIKVTLTNIIERLSAIMLSRGYNFDLYEVFQSKIITYYPAEIRIVAENTIEYVDEIWTIGRIENELPKFLASL